MISVWLEQKLKIWEHINLERWWDDFVADTGVGFKWENVIISVNLPAQRGALYLFLSSFEAAAIALEIIKGFLHQAVQIHLVAELQLQVSLQHYGHHHQQLVAQWR